MTSLSQGHIRQRQTNLGQVSFCVCENVEQTNVAVQLLITKDVWMQMDF